MNASARSGSSSNGSRDDLRDVPRDVSRTELRRHAAELLDTEGRLLEQLEKLLASESQVVAGEDIAALERVGEQRQDCVAALMRLDGARHDACRMHSFGDGQDAYLRLLDWCDPPGALRQRWRANLDLARHCRELNDRNGAIVAIRLNTVQKLLNSLRGTESAPAYGPPAAKQPRLVSRALGSA